MANSKRDIVTVDSLKDQEFRTLLMIGKTGTGKSSLCNRIAGHAANSNIFPVSAKAESCTQSTVLANVHFGGDKERPVSLIDTMGFDDPKNDTDVTIIAELVSKLKNKCDFVNLFGIAVNGQSPRLDGSLIAMIKIFEEMFGEAFWKQCVLVFTRMPMDKRSKKMRAKNADGKSDDELAKDYIKIVQSMFPNSSSLQYLFLDACFDEDDEDEKEEFGKAMETLYVALEAAPKLKTLKVNENVHTDNFKLKKAMEQAEKKHKQEIENSKKREQEVLKQKYEADEKHRKEIENSKERELDVLKQKFEADERHRKESENSKKREQEVLKQKYEVAEKHRKESENAEKRRQGVLKQKDEEAKRHRHEKKEMLEDTKKRQQEHLEEMKNIRAEMQQQQPVDENNEATAADIALTGVGLVAGGTAVIAASVAAAPVAVIAGAVAGVTAIVKTIKG